MTLLHIQDLHLWEHASNKQRFIGSLPRSISSCTVTKWIYNFLWIPVLFSRLDIEFKAMNLRQQRLSRILLMTIQLLPSVNQIAEIKQRTYYPQGSYIKRLIGSLHRSISSCTVTKWIYNFLWIPVHFSRLDMEFKEMDLRQQWLSRILVMTIRLLSSVNQIAEIKQRTNCLQGSYRKRLIGSLHWSISSCTVTKWIYNFLWIPVLYSRLEMEFEEMNLQKQWLSRILVMTIRLLPSVNRIAEIKQRTYCPQGSCIKWLIGSLPWSISSFSVTKWIYKFLWIPVLDSRLGMEFKELNLRRQRLSRILIKTIWVLPSVNQIAEIKQRTYYPQGSYIKRLIRSLPRSISSCTVTNGIYNFSWIPVLYSRPEMEFKEMNLWQQRLLRILLMTILLLSSVNQIAEIKQRTYRPHGSYKKRLIGSLTRSISSCTVTNEIYNFLWIQVLFSRSEMEFKEMDLRQQRLKRIHPNEIAPWIMIKEF